MFRTKKSILLLPLASLAIFAVAFGIAFMDHRYSNDHGSVILTYVVALYFFCCACSVVSGVFAVRRKADRLPLLAWIAKIILYLAVIVTFADIVNLIFSGVPLGADKFNMFFVFVITLLCFTLLFTAFFAVLREAIRRALDFHTWIIFATQIMWIGFAVASWTLLECIQNYCLGS